MGLETLTQGLSFMVSVPFLVAAPNKGVIVSESFTIHSQEKIEKEKVKPK